MNKGALFLVGSFFFLSVFFFVAPVLTGNAIGIGWFFDETTFFQGASLGSGSSGGGSSGGSSGGGSSSGAGGRIIQSIVLDKSQSSAFVSSSLQHSLVLDISGVLYVVNPVSLGSSSVSLLFVDSGNSLVASAGESYFVDLNGDGSEDVTFQVGSFSGSQFAFSVSLVEQESLSKGLNQQQSNNSSGSSSEVVVIGGGNVSPWVLLLLAVPLITAVGFLVWYFIIRKRRL